VVSLQKLKTNNSNNNNKDKVLINAEGKWPVEQIRIEQANYSVVVI
jgi:hypothetical protein